MKFLKNAEGFTLVELMVVVAIIGILSAVAIPNFSRYQSKSKTTEGQLQLASVYSAEVAIQTDYDTFATCLAEMGYSSPNLAWLGATPTAQGGVKNYYAVGFAADNATQNADVVANGGVCVDATSYAVPSGRIIAGKRLTMADFDAASVVVDATSFVAEAIGIVDSSSPTVCGTRQAAGCADNWTINQDKILIHRIIGY